MILDSGLLFWATLNMHQYGDEVDVVNISSGLFSIRRHRSQVLHRTVFFNVRNIKRIRN